MNRQNALGVFAAKSSPAVPSSLDGARTIRPPRYSRRGAIEAEGLNVSTGYRVPAQGAHRRLGAGRLLARRDRVSEQPLQLGCQAAGIAGLEIGERVGSEVLLDGGKSRADDGNSEGGELEDLVGKNEVAVAIVEDRHDTQGGLPHGLHHVAPGEVAMREAHPVA